MKAAPYVSLLWAASAAAAPPTQQPLGNFPLPNPKHIADTLKKPLDDLKKPFDDLRETLKGLSEETQKIWAEVSMMFPEAFDPSNLFSSPKPHKKRPDHEWDVITKGEDLQSVWVTNSNGEKEREIDGHLSPYSLRTKKVDPSTLGVDKVKQYSGYLDDDEADKHLFYCKSSIPSVFQIYLPLHRVL
jgi:cathepsin A (carboxypeptidase C)